LTTGSIENLNKTEPRAGIDIAQLLVATSA